MDSSISFTQDADSNYHCPIFTRKMEILPPRTVHLWKAPSVVCILKTQESHEQFSSLKNSLLLLGTTLGSRTKSKYHSSFRTLQFVVWGKWCVFYFSHWHRCAFLKYPRKLVLAFQTFLRSKTALYLPQLLLRLGLFTIITWV